MYIDKEEVLRYLAYHSKEIDPLTNAIIDESIEEVKEISNINYVYTIFNMEKLDEKILLKECSLSLNGKDIYNHLKQSEKCALLAVTLGHLIDQKIRYYSKINLTKSLIFDAVATTAVESLCDKVEEPIKAYAKEHGFHTTYRYSPGYGDFSLSIQPRILQVLDTQKKIGLTATDNFILTPRKSVTAVIGFQRDISTTTSKNCDTCSLNLTCSFKKDGDACAYKKNNG